MPSRQNDPSKPQRPIKRRVNKRPVATTNVYHMLTAKKTTIPLELGSKNVSKFSLEIIDVGEVDVCDPEDPNRNNHCIFRLTFAEATPEATPHAPIKTRGLVLDVVPDEQKETTTTCEFHMKTFQYEGPHRDALEVIDLPIRGKKTARDFVRVLRNSGMIPCEFIWSELFLDGYRDFASQFIYHLNDKKVLELPEDAATTIFGQFNLRLNDGVEDTPAPVTYAVFTKDYEHVSIEGIEYKGTRRVQGEDDEEDYTDNEYDEE
ncbi:hypothetical protein N7457_002498 [Penicillium paradoxum]|uniref:uncharacterized protein n=1 Tax=Penicillium paradoxum TaxID=176176 RepID=UPI0025489707|nr:uncharacterized protein N7457_002498 [Penicillium paradoxum]KAJ5787508.1 hypothetical protein N7457_002498 [Penicillium paradoxum]